MTQDLIKQNISVVYGNQATDYYGSWSSYSAYLDSNTLNDMSAEDILNDSDSLEFDTDLNISVCIGNLRQVNEKKVLEVLNGSY